MTENWQRTVAIGLLGLLGGGIIAILYIIVAADGTLAEGDAGEIAAAFLALREIISKMEKIALGGRYLPGGQGEPV